MQRRRTTHRSRSGKKLYAVRDVEGRFVDIQTYERAHKIDLKRAQKRRERMGQEATPLPPKKEYKKPELTEFTKTMPRYIHDRYGSLWGVFRLAYLRASKGKGHERHDKGEDFTQQWILRGLRAFGIGGALFQIGKKAEELVRFEDRQMRINELLDIVNYAAAAAIYEIEQLKKDSPSI